MKEYNMLQVFALDKVGQIRHVDEVKRGLACECRCPACNQTVMAKQGDIKGWHFAHVSGVDCKSAGETAIHQAAKQLILEEKGILVPVINISADYQLPDGRRGNATVSRPEMWLDFTHVEAEVRIGDIQPDIVGYLDEKMFFIEIAVWHFVDRDKQGKLLNAGIPTLEIDLSSVVNDDINWTTLKKALFEVTDRKFWIEELDKNRLELEAKEMAMEDALSQPLQKHSSAVSVYRFMAKGRHLRVSEYPYGLTVWFQYDEALKEKIKEVAKSLGGKYQPKYKSWLFRPESKTFLMAQITEIADAIN